MANKAEIKIYVTEMVAAGLDFIHTAAIAAYYLHGKTAEAQKRAEKISEIHEAAFAGFITGEQLRSACEIGRDLALEGLV